MDRFIGLLAVLIVIALLVNRCYPLSHIGRESGGRGEESCRIKGNISRDGERIYHVPGQKWYSRTRIDEYEGERWFCDEKEARAAGWRKAYE